MHYCLPSPKIKKKFNIIDKIIFTITGIFGIAKLFDLFIFVALTKVLLLK